MRFLFYFFMVFFCIFGIADVYSYGQCSYSDLLRVSSSKKFVQPQTNGAYSRFRDGKYVMVGRDFVVVWMRLLVKRLKIKVNYKGYTYGDNILFFEPYGQCMRRLQLPPHKETGLYYGQGSFIFDFSRCSCRPYQQNGYYYFPIKIWTEKDVFSLSFEQRNQDLKIFLFKEEAEKWDYMPTCPNAKNYKTLDEIRIDGKRINGASPVSGAGHKTYNGKKPFYRKNGNDYIKLDFPETVILLEVKDWSQVDYTVLLIELQEGETLDESIEIKIEANGEAPDVNAAELINDNTGLRITFKNSQCQQYYVYLGFLRYVIKTSVTGKLRASFYYQNHESWRAVFHVETVLLFEGILKHAVTNNRFTPYWLIYTPPTTTTTTATQRLPRPTTSTRLPTSTLTPPTEAPPAPTETPEPPPTETPEPSTFDTSSTTQNPTESPSSTSTTIIPSSTSSTTESSSTSSTTESSNGNGTGGNLPEPSAQNGNDNDKCDGYSIFFWLMIICICIDIILVIILVLLIIFAHRGSKKMKAIMSKKKKGPKGAASKQGISPAAAATTSPKKEKGKKGKTTEKSTEDETKPSGGKTGGGKTTDGKTTTFYTVDQTKYYTIDTTFDKSKKGKK